MKANAVILSLTLLVAWSATASTATAQSALERLERQIRQRSEASDTAAHPPTTEPTETQRPSDNAGAAYLGIVANDRKDRGRGVRILNVQPGSPAEKAGLRRDDLITSVADIRTRQMSDMSDVLATFGPGQAVDFDVLRDGKPRQLRVVLGSRPAAAQRSDSPETVPLPPAEIIPEPPPPQAGPKLQPPRPIDQASPDASRIEQLERRVDDLQRRVDELERALKSIKKE